MLCWGFNAVILKSLLLVVSAKNLVFIRIIIATVFLFIIYVLKKEFRGAKFKQLDWAWALFGGFFYIYLQLVFYFIGLQRTSAANAVLIAALSPAVAMILESCIFNKRFRLLQKFGVLASFIGVALATSIDEITKFSVAGIVFIGFSVVLASLGGCIMQSLTDNHSGLKVSLAFHLSGLFFFVVESIFISEFSFSDLISIDSRTMIIMLTFSIINGGVATLIWGNSVKFIGLTATSSYLPLVPFFGLLSSSFVLNESLTNWHIFGLICVSLGTFAVVNSMNLNRIRVYYGKRRN